MKYFAGMDVSLEETAICVVDETGRMVKEVRAMSEPDALHGALASLGLAFERVGLEACSLTAWLHGELTSAGWPAICIESRHAKAAMGAMPNKTDRNDARAIAQIMRTGWFKAVHVKTPTCRLWRSLLVARRAVLNEMRTIENVVRSILRETGLKVGTPARKDFIARVRELAVGEKSLAMMTEPLLEILATMLREFSRLTKQVLVIIRDEPICRRLMSAPGVGPLTALAFRATIDQPERFKKSRDVGAHLGLTPRRYQSGETDIQGRVSRCGDELARTALYEAAHSLLVRGKKWSALRAWGMQIAKRRGMARARVAVARKLATILHRMWIDGADFQFGRQQPAGSVVKAITFVAA
jgi:transposase